jgi:integrase
MRIRTREYLTTAEVEKLMAEAKGGRWGHRDATMILIAYRHGLRAAEIADLEWSEVELGRKQCFMCAGSRTASQASIRCAAMRSARSANCAGNSPRAAARHSIGRFLKAVEAKSGRQKIAPRCLLRLRGDFCLLVI